MVAKKKPRHFPGIPCSGSHITLSPQGSWTTTTTTGTGKYMATPEELAELDELQDIVEEEQKEARRVIFQSLPIAIRQSCADDIHIERLLYELENPFTPHLARMQELRRKTMGLNHSAGAGADYPSPYCGNPILERFRLYFTDDEILDMHASCCLNEIIKE